MRVTQSTDQQVGVRVLPSAPLSSEVKTPTPQNPGCRLPHLAAFLAASVIVAAPSSWSAISRAHPSMAGQSRKSP